MGLTVCWAVKGGSGTTVVAAALGLAAPGDTLLVDLDGELPVVLGLPEASGQGVADWLASDAPPGCLVDLAVEVAGDTRLVPRGMGAVVRTSPRWAELGTWLTSRSGDAVVDAGTGTPPDELLAAGGRGLLVTRGCYLALLRATTATPRPDGIIVVVEPGRALGVSDIERAVGAPVVATVSHDPAVWRAVDAGLLRTRLPRVLRHELRRAA